jgi:hypothetical protein
MMKESPMLLAVHKYLRAGLGFLLLVVVPILSASGQEKQQAIDQIARKADVIAVGRVTSMQSEWNADKSRIFTRVTLSVDQYLKEGSASSKTITVFTPGGEVGDVGEIYTHVPTFRRNEEVVVFLKKNDAAGYRVAAGMQGKYVIEKDPQTGQSIVAGKYPLSDFTDVVRKAAN